MGMESATAFIVGTLLSALALWVGIRFAGVGVSFLALLLIAGISSLFGIIPTAGWIISLIVLFVLIWKWTDANFFPDAVMVVIVAKAVDTIFVSFLCLTIN